MLNILEISYFTLFLINKEELCLVDVRFCEKYIFHHHLIKNQ